MLPSGDTESAETEAQTLKAAELDFLLISWYNPVKEV